MENTTNRSSGSPNPARHRSEYLSESDRRFSERHDRQSEYRRPRASSEPRPERMPYRERPYAGASRQRPEEDLRRQQSSSPHDRPAAVRAGSEARSESRPYRSSADRGTRLYRTDSVRADAPQAAGRHSAKRKKQTALPLVLFLVGLVVLAVLVILLMNVLFGGSEARNLETRDGIAFLESMEAKDPAVIDEALAAIRKQRIEVERDLILKRLTDDESDVWSMFHDYVILGDSRAVGFYYYDFLDKNRVLAGGGDTIRKIEEHMDEIKKLKPSYIFLCYGLNDVSIGYWDTPEEYTAEFMQTVEHLQQEVPTAKIIVSSILPARDPAFDIASIWREIPTYSDMLQAACEENGILFVDNSQTAEDHADLWDIDGIHVKYDFYDYWARNLIVAVIEDEAYE